MPMELAEKINAIDDVDVFIHDFVDFSNSLSNISSIQQDRTSRKRKFYLRFYYSNKNNSKINIKWLMTLVESNPYVAQHKKT